jgi:hypothetical protein
MLSDKIDCLFIFSIFGSAFVVIRMDNLTHSVIGAIGAGLKSSVLEAAQLYLALGLVYIPLAVFVSQLAAATSASCGEYSTGLTVGSATCDFSYGHYTSLSLGIGFFTSLS